MNDREWIERYGSTCREIEQEDRCQDCGGSGIKTYGSTATWHGGVGGWTPTDDACDKCWGSGNRHKPWPSHREIKRAVDALKRYREHRSPNAL